MRIVIDMQGAQTESRVRGIGRYSLAFAQALARNRGNHEIVLALNDLFADTVEPLRAAFQGLLPQRDIRVWSAPGPVREVTPGNGGRRRVAALIREAFLMSLKPDVVHLSSMFEGYPDDAVTSIGELDSTTPVSVTLYDLIPLVNADCYLTHDARYARHYRSKVEQLRRASLLLAISQSSQAEARAHLPGLDCEVVNVSTAVTGEFRPARLTGPRLRGLKGRFGIDAAFVLYTGGGDERKNLARLIQAYARLAPRLRNQQQLVIAGVIPQTIVEALRQEAAAAGLDANAVIFTGYVSDEALVQLYSACHLFVFPSWHEGFGLPALEAMQCGAPVIGANTSSVPEVIGRADALFDPFDVAAICRKMTEVLEKPDFRCSLAASGLDRAKAFSWDRTACSALAAFERLHATRGARGGSQAARAVPQAIEAIARCCSEGSPPADLAEISRAIARIPVADARPRLFVDVSELSQRDARTGIQRVTRSVLDALLKQPPAGFDVQPVYGTLDTRGYRYASSFLAGRSGTATGNDADLPIDFAAGDIFLGLDLQHDVVCAQQPYLEELRRHGVLVTFIVYDLLPIALPGAFPPGADSGHRTWLNVITRFDGAVCISAAVANELDAWLRINPAPRLRPFPIRSFRLGSSFSGAAALSGAAPDAAANDERTLETLAAGTSFLTVGTVEPRKGHEQILLAFELLWRRGLQANLVIVGKQGWMVSALCDRLRRHPERNRRLFWLEGISDSYLEQLYAASSCLIAASLAEGFGLPLIEAAHQRLPIIARDIPVFREVAGEHACYFHGNGPTQLAEQISAWLDLYRAGLHPASAGMKLLSWQQSTEELLRIVLDMRDEVREQTLTENGTRVLP